MSAVDDFVGGAAEEVGDFVSQAGEDIGNAGKEVWQEVNNLGSSLDNFVQNIVKDPWAAIATIAAVVTQQYWAIPLIAGADTAIKGGSIEDIATSVAVSYVAGQVGQYAGQWATNAVAGSEALGSGIGQGAGQAMGEGLGSGIGQGTSQGISGGLGGGIGSGIGSGLGQGVGSGLGSLASSGLSQAATAGTAANAFARLAGNIVGSGAANATAQLIKTGQVDTDKVLTAMASGGINAGVNLLSSYIPGFNTLPTTVQRAAIAAVSAELTGRDPSAAAVNVALSAGLNEIGKMLKEDPKMTEALTNSVKLSDTSQAYNDAAVKYGEKINEYESNIEKVNSSYASLNDIKSKYDEVLSRYNASNDPSEWDALKTQLTSLSSQYDSEAKNLEGYRTTMTSLQEEISGLANQASGLRQDYLVSAMKVYDPNYDAKALAASIDQQTKDAYSGKSLEDLYFSELGKNPEAKFYTNWNDLIQNTTDPTKLDTVAQAWKNATGFDLNAGNAQKGLIDENTFSLYKQSALNVVDQYLNAAQEAQAKGDFNGYVQNMQKANELYMSGEGANFGSKSSDLNTEYFSNVLSGLFTPSSTPGQINLGWFNPTSAQTSTKGVTRLAPGAVQQQPLPTGSGQTVTTYGFGELNPMLSDIMKENQGANSYLRSTYTYDPLAAENRLKNISRVDMSQFTPEVADLLKQKLPDGITLDGNFYTPGAVYQNFLGGLNALGNTSYNAPTNQQTALDYLKGGGALGTYFEAYSNPYAAVPKTAVSGLGQLASNWSNGNGVNNAAAQSLLAKNLIS